jgi:glycerophosphoryl diester phosphodiesterase
MTSFAQISYIGHRGASYLAPENTEASITLAWELQSAGAECDVMLTKDHKVIVFHDSNGKRLLGKDWVIRETNYKDLKHLPIKLKPTHQAQYKNSTIPLLKDLLKKLPKDQLLVIEIKDEIEIIPYLKKIIDKYWQQGKIAFIAFDYETIIRTKAIYPEVPCYYLSSTLKDIEARFEDISHSDLDGVDLNHKIITSNLVDRFKSVNKEVWCWTVNTVEDAIAMRKAGITYITTDRPAWLRSQLKGI